MKVEIVYPHQSKTSMLMQKTRMWIRWVFIVAAIACPIINLFFGGKPWSIVVVWGLWMIWSFVFFPYLVEYNRISQVVKLIANSAIMLIFIGVFFSHGWVTSVVPIVCFSGMILMGLLFFNDLNKQKQNMMPMLWMIGISLIATAVLLIFWPENCGWQVVVMGLTALALLLVCIFTLGLEIVRELKKRFYVK